uniref:Sister chromatid cohesion protein n=1 Tax=Chromera velia CCMP2878 TaxID=1169474 RepID=A0A0G4F001_9ALVE|eukprot:Cvel_2552.t1-p1 / transcript=Cvel_2552.t1 / gene=Cvel_2552 / organism=Chromera_velia_CCMP2878 / gene_product=hypothetical protein / transcript_product=hypothetical protein / location=Cvel_scaffold101:36-8788(+) / protein_length=1284 / sequence_SO=supercontig / SO=protein_coding / is_pseudo=false
MGLLNCLLFDQAAGVRGILKEEEMAGREGGGEDEAGISLSVSLDGNGGGESSPVGAGAGRGTGNGASFGRQFLRRCVGRLESALNDPSPLVRKSAVGILQAVVLEEPQSDVALQVCLQFVDRVVDREETDHVKGLTLDLFRKLWVSGAVEFNRTICTHMIQSVRYFEKRRTQFRIDSDSLLAQVVERAKTVWEKEATGGRGGRKSNPVDAALERWATELRGALADTHGGDLEGGGGEGGHEGGAAAAAAASSAPGAASTRLQRTNTASSSYAFFQNSKRLTQTAVLAVLEIVAEMKPSLVTGCWGNLTPLLAPPEWKNMSPQERAEKAEVLAIVGRIVTRLCPHLTNAESRPSEEIVELQEILLIHMQTGPLNRSIIEAVKCFCALAQHIRRDVFHVVNLLVNGIQQIHSVYQEVFRARQWLLFHNQRGYRPAGAEMSLEEAREALLKKAPHRLRRFILVVGAVWDSVDVNAVCLEIATKEEEEAEGVKQEEEDGSYRSPPSSTNRNCPQTPTRGKRGTPRRSPSSKGRGSAALSTALSKTPVSEARLRRVSSSALEKMMQERGMGSEAVRPYGRDPARACFEDFCKLWDLGGKEGGGMSAASGGMPLRDQIKGMVLDGLLLFLNGQRKFIREKKLHDILENALRHPVLQLKGLHLMHELLKQAQEDAVKRAKEEAARLPSTVIKVKAEEGGGLEDEDDDGMGDQSDDAEAGLTGPTRKGRRSTGCALKSPHTNGDAATHDDTTHIHDEERMAGERDSAQPLALLLPSVLNCIRGTQQGGSTPSGTTGTPNRHERERQHQHEGGGGGNSNSNSSLLVCSLALDVVERLRAAGFINPSQAIAPVFCLSFSDNALLRSQTARVLRLITETRRETLLSSLGDCLLDAFFFLLRRFPGQLRLFEPLRPSSLQPFVDLYARTFQQKRRDRERSIRVLLHQLETLSESERLGKFMEKVKEVRKKQKEEQRSDFEEFSNEKFLLLFLQFAASTVAALPCVFESEALFAVHRLNHLISIKSHLQTANPGGEEEGDSEMGDPEGGEGGAGVSAVSPSGLGGLGGDPQQRVPEMEVFGLCACVCTALILKDCFKTAYGLSDERCAQYDPGEALLREQKKYAGVGRGVLLAGGDEEGEKGEEFGGAVESSFDIDAFEERCTALLDASGDVALLRGELAEAVASADGTKDLNEALLAKQVKTAEERQWRELLGKGKRKSAAAGGEEEDEEGKGTKRGRGGPSAKALAKRSAARPKKAAGGVSGQKTKAKGGKKKKRRRGEDEDSDEEDDDESDFVP